MGVTVRELRGWSPKTVTLDADGKVVSVSASQPRFTPREVAWLLASRLEERAQRGPHGFTVAEATDPKNFGRFKVPPPTVDFAAKALHEAQQSWASKHGEQAGMEYTLWRVEKKT